ncbi:unnamed protein product [Gongylonema pulchrum]|uniref:Enhancer of polycomb-like protein n=1 Tax=Gongylonema pulchrum TaxID=637853 RepID=A0A183DT10_9BILA|nr:unnamed protein product [Gongylonema pulchrum]
MESHLQEAILAQQASTSGIAVENHVIPTPKVFAVDNGQYDTVYPVQPAPSINQLIKVQASLSLGNEEPEYDIDSEDEAWLAERGGHLLASDFEKMMELLEGASSGLQICQPSEARTLLKGFDTDLVDDVYDYWLQKRKDAAASRKNASLIPRVKTDARRDVSGLDAAYVAFRRRLERMQTRKNRKNDEDSYEKILKLGYDLGRAAVLFDMLRRREYTKQAVIDFDKKICSARWLSFDFGSLMYQQLLAKVRFERMAAMSPTDESVDEMPGSMSPSKVKTHKRKRHSRSSVSEADKEPIATRAWLKRNAELWNKPAVAANVFNAGASPVAASSADTERNAEAAVDGRYTFKRRRGCVYRASLLSTPSEAPRISPAERFHRTFMPTANGVRCIGYTRRRMGRGGRSYQWKLVEKTDNAGDDSSSDFEEERDDKEGDDAEAEYMRREELYARRIYGLSSFDSTQGSSARMDSRGGISPGNSGEQIVVLDDDDDRNESVTDSAQGASSVNGIRSSSSRLTVLK